MNWLYFVLDISIVFYLNDLTLAKKEPEKCVSCTKLVENLIQNLKRTQKGNFGGGNTDWEDRKLGSYLTSETRFEEIIENICDDSDCHRSLEENEDFIFDKFKNSQKTIESELHGEFCVQKLKKCCQAGTFGANCESCQKSFERICSGNGDCNGDGTRTGDGKCKCHSGYNGELCDSCNVNYFEEFKNETLIKCAECHRSCENDCTGPGSGACLKCKAGWIMNEETNICEDTNECLQESTCKENEFCLNNEGSFTCFECDPSCIKCTGLGADKCLDCNTGYKRDTDNQRCLDVDECALDANLCGLDQKCVNKPGSFECKETNTDKKVENEPTEEEEDENEDKTDETPAIPLPNQFHAEL